MATNSITLINGTTAYASDVETKVNPLYTDLDPSNVNSTYLTGTGDFVLATSPTITSPILAGASFTGDVTFDTTTLFVDATNDVVQMGTVGAVPSTFTGVQLYTQTTSTNAALFESTSASTAGPELFLYHNSSSPANNDVVGKIRFYGNDSGADAQEWAQIRTIISDVTAASEDSVLAFYTCDAGTLAERMRISSDGQLLINETSNPLAAASTTPLLGVHSTSDSDVAVFSSGNTGTAGVYSYYYHNSSSPAAGDNVALLRFYGNDSGGNETEYGRLHVELDDPTDGSEDSSMFLQVLSAGTQTTGLDIDGTNQKIGLPSGWELDLPAVDPPTANLANRNSLVKGWVNYTDGAPGSIATSFNVSSVGSDDGDGVFTINWNTNAATNYTVIGNSNTAAGSDTICTISLTSAGVTTLTFYDVSSAANQDGSFCALAIGDQ